MSDLLVLQKALSTGHGSLVSVMRGDSSLINSEPWASGSRPVASSQKGSHRWKSGAVGLVDTHHQVACPQVEKLLHCDGYLGH